MTSHSPSSGRIDADHDTVSQLLLESRAGDPDALGRLLPIVYNQLHQLAKQQRRHWSGDETLNTTALVHEAYLRLAGNSAAGWENRAHFFAVASRAMRHILVDYAKRQHSAKRGGNHASLPLDNIEAALQTARDPAEAGTEALIALDEALRRLEQHDVRQSRIVECRFFGGMAIQETAEALGVSPATVKRGWVMAQAWLHRELARTLEVET